MGFNKVNSLDFFLESLESSGTDNQKGTTKSKKATKRASSSGTGKSLFSIEYAKSGRSTCRGCGEKILQVYIETFSESHPVCVCVLACLKHSLPYINIQPRFFFLRHVLNIK